MATYKVVEKWSVFKEFIIEELNNRNRDKIGFMHTDNEIIIRSLDPKILSIIGKEYELTECEMPDFLFDEWSKWSFFGNHRLFEENEPSETLRFI